ncbi:MAG: hypothetical protein FOGNACKC_00765 [Anaerolineae bacterium]|nr:hypothetical protein [Anaerolineae bacterium]
MSSPRSSSMVGQYVEWSETYRGYGGPVRVACAGRVVAELKNEVLQVRLVRWQVGRRALRGDGLRLVNKCRTKPIKLEDV